MDGKCLPLTSESQRNQDLSRRMLMVTRDVVSPYPTVTEVVSKDLPIPRISRCRVKLVTQNGNKNLLDGLSPVRLDRTNGRGGQSTVSRHGTGTHTHPSVGLHDRPQDTPSTSATVVGDDEDYLKRRTQFPYVV